jgi:Ca2+-binding RTX toxin-like protein
LIANFYNSAGRKTLTVSGIGTVASDAEVLDGSIDFGGWGFWHDTIIGNKYADRLYGYARNDTLRGNGGGDELGGGSGADSLFGGGGDDTLLGGTGADRLAGNPGNDVIAGGSGDDDLTGGSSADMFVFGRDSGSDRITDFENGLDQIRIDSGAKTLADLDIKKSGADTVVEFANVSITFNDTRMGELSGGDFWFG